MHTEFKGVVVGEEEGLHIAQSLGDKKVGTPITSYCFYHSDMFGRPLF